MSEPSVRKVVSYDMGCVKSLHKLPHGVMDKFLTMMAKYMHDPSAKGLNFESIEGARDSSLKSVRVDQAYRAIAFEVGNNIMFVHVNEHDKAYDWAHGKRLKLDALNNRVRLVEEVAVSTTTTSAQATNAPRLFAQWTDKKLLRLGVQEEELAFVRLLEDVEDLEAAEERLDTLTYRVLYGLAAGYSDHEVAAIVGIPESSDATDIEIEAGAINADATEADASTEPRPEPTFESLIDTPESRTTIFTPASADELQRFFHGELDGWRVFLHPDQRKLAYRDYKGPALVRGGAGTGKSVVAMHRAKYLADRLAKEDETGRRRVLFTTFTTSLAHDIEANLHTLCPEHFAKGRTRIEVKNLDRWVNDFLKKKNFERRVAYFGEAREQVEQIWQEVLMEHELPAGLTKEFVEAEWKTVVQAQGILEQSAYLRAPRKGRGTPLDRRKRAALWQIFSDVRARLTSAKLAEPDDAYRMATELLKAEAPNLPYTAVIVDEAQDMGEQAFRLIRAIVPPTAEGDANSVFLVGDAHQRIYARKASLSACGLEVRGRSRRLRLNYRTSHEIRAFAVALLKGMSVDDLDDGTDVLEGYISAFHDTPPTRQPCGNEDEELTRLLAWAQAQAKAGIALEDVCVLVNTHKQVDRVQDFLVQAGTEAWALTANRADDRSVPGIRVTTMHRAKGLEFTSIALPFLSDGQFPSEYVLEKAVDAADREDLEDQYRSLLHVAATRAKRALYVSWSGAPSALLHAALG